MSQGELSQGELSRGELFILSAPSGTGKTTLIRSLMSGELARFVDRDLHFSVSHTTRSPRDAEVDGADYQFIGVDEFQRLVGEGRFLEWAEVHNNYYGTSLDEVLPYIEAGVDVLMDIDVQGAERILAKYPAPCVEPLLTAVHSIFIMPPSYADLRKRLLGRNLDDPDQISGRLAVSRWEMQSVKLYDYVIVNDDAEVASYVLASLVVEKRHRRERMKRRIAEVLSDFPEQ